MPQTDVFRLVGQQLDHRYLIERVVGEGGFGVVYRAWHTAFHRPVAIKCLKCPNTPAASVIVARFREEASLLYRLHERCTSVVQVLDVGVIEPAGATSVPYLVMEWLDGMSLREALAAWRARGAVPMNEVAAAALLAPALQALACAHRGEAGVVVAHRDVKPDNVFVLASGGLKLLDFGIAKVMQEGAAITMAGDHTSSGFSSFSPTYGAPEQFNPRAMGETGPWTDVHALGLLLVELVTGRRALDGADYPGCFTASLDPSRPTPRRLGATVSDGFEAICARALALDPRQRFPGGEALLAALTPWIQAGTPPPLGLPHPEPPHPPASPDATTAPAPAPAAVVASAHVASPQTHFSLRSFAPHPAMASPLPPPQPRPAQPYDPSTGLGAIQTMTFGAAAPPVTTAPVVATPAPALSSPSAPASLASAPSAPSRTRWPLALGLLGAMTALAAGVALIGSRLTATDAPRPPSSAPAASAPGSAAASAPGQDRWIRRRVPLLPAPSASARAAPDARLARMVRIEGATFTVSSLGRSEEKPRKATVAAFLLDETEVTVEAYRQCVAAGACTDTELTWARRCNWAQPDRDQHPINCLAPTQAEEFCRWAGRRLPSEDEWELAARGAQGRTYPWGSVPPGAKVCWNGPGNEAGQGYRTGTCPVGSSPFDVSPAGARDLGGNVHEWTASPDCTSSEEDRAACSRMDCAFRTDRVCQRMRIHRGGSWMSNMPSSLQGAMRAGGLRESGDDTKGFRCARTP